MDKRSIIGFVLILLILLLWPKWSKMINPPSEQPPVEQQQQTTAGLDTTDEVLKETTIAGKSDESQIVRYEETGSPVVPVMEETTVPEKIIRVETEDFIAVLSSYGGLLKSLMLKEYFTENGYNGDSLVEMVSTPDMNPWQANGALTLGVEDSLSFINNAPFEVQGYDITLFKGDDPQTVSFVYSGPDGASVRKDYTFSPEGFDFKLRLSINKPGLLGFTDRFTLGWLTPVLPTEKDYKEDLGKFAGFYFKGDEVIENKDVDVDEPISGDCKWVALRSKYFTNVVISDDNPGSDALIVGKKTSVYDSEGNQHEWKKFGVGLTFNIEGESFTNDLTIYSGPLDYFSLQEIGYKLGELVDMGFWLFRPFSIGALWIFIQLHKVLFNYGLVIIIFSIIMKVVFWPLTRKSSASMMRMKDLQPKLQEIKAKYKNEPQKMNTETMKIYKEYGVNPFGSCLPLLVQLPVFWAMFSVLRNSIELRAADFIFWITDLSQKDPYYILAILMALAMFFQQKMTITDPKQKMIIYIMPAVFLFIFGGMPSGLVLYWAMFSIIGIFEQILVKRHLSKEKQLTT